MMPKDATITVEPVTKKASPKEEAAAVPVEFARAVRAIEDCQKAANGGKPAVFLSANGRRIMLK